MPTTTPHVTCPKERPSLSVDVTKQGAAYFQCTINNPSNQIGIEYVVWFYVNGNIVYSEKLKENNYISRLFATRIRYNLWEARVLCSVETRVRHGNTCNKLQSKIIIPVIKVITKELVVTEGQKGTLLKLETNVPPQMFCDYRDKGRCQIQIESLLKPIECHHRCSWQKTMPQIVIGWSGQTIINPFCGTVVSKTNWKNQIKIPVKATIDGIRDGNQVVHVALTAKVIGTKTKNYTLTPVKVTAIDVCWKNPICGSVNDPHITTFDHVRYNVMLEGEFVLYKHKEYPIEVRMQYKKCSRKSKATCNCAVSVRCVDDVITLSSCGGVVTSHHHQIYKKGAPITVRMFQKGDWTEGFRIRKIGCGQTYEVRLPTGTLVTVKASRGTFLNAFVTPSASTYKKGQGLCGNYDHSTKDELIGRDGKSYKYSKNPNQFSETWRASSTIFNGVAKTSVQQMSGIYCSCIEKQHNYCAIGLDNYKDHVIPKNDVTKLLIQQSKALVAKGNVQGLVKFEHGPHHHHSGSHSSDKKDSHHHHHHHSSDDSSKKHHKKGSSSEPVSAENVVHAERRRRAADLSYGEESDPAGEIWPPTNVWNETAATMYCHNHLVETDIGRKCQSILNTSYSGDIDNCVTDIKYMDNTDWAMAALDGILYHCIQEASLNPSLWIDGQNGTIIPPVNITHGLCLEDCGSYGHCDRGDCICDDDYSGIDCNVTSDTVPDVIPVSADGPCDTQVSNCGVVIVLGNNFVDSTTLICHVQPLTITDKMVPTGSAYVASAIFVSISQVICLVDPSSSRIRVSNDGSSDHLSTDHYMHVVYDSVCFNCVINEATLNATCEMRSDSCIIRKSCLPIGTKNIANECQICDPDRSSSSWSHSNTPFCTKTKVAPLSGSKNTAKSDRSLIIGLSVACGILGLVIIVGGIVIKLRSTPNKPGMEGDHDDALHRYDSVPAFKRDMYAESDPSDEHLYGRL